MENKKYEYFWETHYPFAMYLKKIFLLLFVHCALCIVHCKTADEVKFTASQPFPKIFLGTVDFS